MSNLIITYMKDSSNYLRGNLLFCFFGNIRFLKKLNTALNDEALLELKYFVLQIFSMEWYLNCLVNEALQIVLSGEDIPVH